MKKLNLASIAILCLLFYVAPLMANGQGAETNRSVVHIKLELDNGDTFDLYGDGIILTTPSSNFLKTYKFKVPENVLGGIDFGIFANKIIGVTIDFNSDETLIGIGFLNKAGILTFTVHRNKSGGYFPKGWF